MSFLIVAVCSTSNNQSKTVQLLLNKGADQTLTDDEGRTPLFHAIYRIKNDIVQLFLAQSSVPLTGRDEELRTPLHVAAHRGNVDAITWLLDRGAPIDDQDRAGMTSLQFAIQQSENLALRLLLDRGASVFCLSKRGFNALHFAAIIGNLKATEMILEQHPELIDIAKEDGFTALHLATFNNHCQVIELLLAHADSQGQCRTWPSANRNVENSKKQTPLHLAAVACHDKAVRVLLTRQSLTETGTENQNEMNLLNARDEDGDTALHEVMKRVQPQPESMLEMFAFSMFSMGRGFHNSSAAQKIAEFLIEKGIDVTIRNTQNETAFDVCPNDAFKLKLSLAMSGGGDVRRNEPSTVPANPATSDIEKAGTVAESHVSDNAKFCCKVCLENVKNIIFQCGHMFCSDCSMRMSSCPVCRAPITSRITVYH